MRSLTAVIPKGRIFKNVVNLFEDVGININLNKRAYRPEVSDPELVMKIMKPQNIPSVIELGSHDIGFTGHDWVIETDCRVKEIMDLKLDPVRIVAAVPEHLSHSNLSERKIIVASEYENIARDFLESQNYDYRLIRTYGATEVFPPDDADMIIDNTSTGRTLKEHNLKIIHNIMESSTRFIASGDALEDEDKKNKIEELKMLFRALLDARERVMLEMNVPPDKFESLVKQLPCMRSPTVAPLYKEEGFAVKIAVKKSEVIKIIPNLKRLGATDILEYDIRKVVI